MKNRLLIIKLMTLGLILFNSYAAYSETVLPSPNGIEYPSALKSWKVLGTSYRTDNNTQRVILGNSIAINASLAEKTNPWPEGSIIAKLVWKNTKHPSWETAIVPGKFIHSEIMVKNSKKYKATGGWGFARWKGLTLKPYGIDKNFSQECLTCHTHVKDHDYVFTFPAKYPKLNQKP